MKLIIPFLFLSLQGCSYDDFPCNGSFSIQDAKISADHSTAIVVAGNRWNKFLGREHFNISTQGQCPIYVEEIGSGIKARYQYEDGKAKIRIAPSLLAQDVSIERFTAIITHELGHSEKLDHVEGQGPAIMSELTFSGGEITQADRRECLRVGLCS